MRSGRGARRCGTGRGGAQHNAVLRTRPRAPQQAPRFARALRSTPPPRPHRSAKTQLVRVDPQSGVLKWGGVAGRDTFESEVRAAPHSDAQTQAQAQRRRGLQRSRPADRLGMEHQHPQTPLPTPPRRAAAPQAAAQAYLRAPGGRVDELAAGKALLGYAVLGPAALLLVAEQVRASAVLPGGHEVKTVTQSRWTQIALQVSEVGWGGVGGAETREVPGKGRGRGRGRGSGGAPLLSLARPQPAWLWEACGMQPRGSSHGHRPDPPCHPLPQLTPSTPAHAPRPPPQAT